MSLSHRTCFLVNLRDRLSCQSCGQRPLQQTDYHRGFEYHHIVPRSEDGNDEPENITLLCHNCHRSQHAKTKGLALPTTVPPKLFACNLCGFDIDSLTVEVNCGWYRCPHCNEIIHLYSHFGYDHADP